MHGGLPSIGRMGVAGIYPADLPPGACPVEGGAATGIDFPLASEAKTPMTHSPVKMAKATRRLETSSSCTAAEIRT